MSTLRSGFLVALFLPALGSGGAARAQAPAAVSTEVVVTAEARPVESKTLGSAATVLDRAEIERRQQSTLLELLRSVPGLDVVQSGGPGTVTSLFLRGTNSTQALVLVDGVKLNSPYFGGVDLSSIPATNVEKIEVLRGPFSALWGSEAVGGVVQIFTRRATASGFAFTGQLAGGTDAQREASATVSGGTGTLEATASIRRHTEDGALPNEFFAVTNASGAVDVTLADGARAGVVVRHDASRTGVPYSGGRVSPRRSTTLETTSVAVPASVALGGGTTLDAALTLAWDSPTLEDPDDPHGFTFAETKARRQGARVSASRTVDAHRVSVGVDWERTEVRNEDSYGLELDDLTTRTFSAFAEDRIAVIGDALVATVGLRWDDHSAFGAEWSPRLALAWRPTPALKVRVAGGRAFRAPSTGELYYPFSGNALLNPERSTSVEGGVELNVTPGLVAEATLFSNRIRDLIQYEFASGTNQNVGNARTEGAEVVLRGAFGDGFFARASWTWLQATDLDADRPLLRRAKHRASVTLGKVFDGGASAELTGLFVGRRPDVDSITYGRVMDPSYLRVDVAATGPRLLGYLSPFVRVTNLLGRDYQEAAGFPAPGRRFFGGLGVAF